MRLDDLPPATSVFIDANIFTYHFTGASDECTRFLSRCEVRELAGVTSVSVLLEVLHRLMMVEAVKTRAVRSPKVLEKLRKRPEGASRRPSGTCGRRKESATRPAHP